MHRSARLLLTVALFAITAIILFGAARLVHVDAQDSWTTVAANERLVAHFYTAINEAIATGDTVPLDALLAPDFVEEAPLPGSGPDRSRLAALLVELHLTRPQYRLVVGEVIANTENTFATVQVDSATLERLLGMPVEPDAGIWGPTDGFKIAEGRITAHWNNRTAMILAESLLDDVLPALSVTGTDVELLRLTLAPSASARTPLAPGPTVYVAESGTIFVETGRAESYNNPGAAFDILVAGEAVVIPPGSQHTLTATENEGAVVLMVALDWQEVIALLQPVTVTGMEPNLAIRDCVLPPPSEEGGRDAGRYVMDVSLSAESVVGLAQLGRGLVVRPLGQSTIGPWPVEPNRVRLGRLTLGPGTSLTLPAGSQHVIVVEAGVLALATNGMSADEGAEATNLMESVVIGSQEMAVLSNWEAQPLRLLVLTMSSEQTPGL